MYKNIEKQKVLHMAEQVDYQDGQIVSRTLVQNSKLSMTLFAFEKDEEISTHAAGGDAMVTVFGILNLTEDSFFDESRRLDPAGAVTAAIEMLRVGSDVVDVGPAASHPDARPVSPADEIRRIAPLLDALSDQMHRVSIDSFQPETQRYALKRGVGYLNDIQGFPDPALYPDIAEADCRLVVMRPFPNECG